MPVVIDQARGIFTIHTKNSTYQFKVGRYGHLLHLYYGRRMAGTADFLLVPADRGFSGNPYEAGEDKTYSLDFLPQELPTSGTGDYRNPAVIIENADGTEAVDFRYVGYALEAGKYSLPGLPAVYCEEGVEEEKQRPSDLWEIRPEGNGAKEEKQRPSGSSDAYPCPEGNDAKEGKKGAFGSSDARPCHEKGGAKEEKKGPHGFSDAEFEDGWEEGKPETLRIFLEDPITHVRAELLYGVVPDIDIITRALVIRNGGEGRIYLEKVQGAVLDFVTGEYDLVTFNGRHAMERRVERTRVVHTNQSICSRRGASSHQYNPFVILAGKNTDEDAGDCWAMAFVYSGGFLAECEMDQYGQTRLQMGLMDEKFRFPLEAGGEFVCPEVIMTYSGEGFARMSHNLHDCIRKHVCRGRFRDVAPRPVLVNSWEASYFNFTGDLLVELAHEAGKDGVEMLVMDDGWFGDRDDDMRALGDWFVNERKLGGSLANLVSRVNREGLKFGIWIEPEMVNENSRLYAQHPDWAMAIPGRKPNRSRFQLLLDFSRREVVDYVYGRISEILHSANIEYVKWDFNRSIFDVYSAATNDQGAVLYKYMLGLYDFLERLNRDFPHVMIEGCSGGGGRFDAGMLYYTPQIWCSDNTDAIDRLGIQYGTSFAYPVSAVGSHVSVCPNEQNGRMTDISVRSAVAMAGSFGYEFSFTRLSKAERDTIRKDIDNYKRLAPLMMNGRYYRLSVPFKDPFTAWEMVARDKSEAVVTAVTTEIHGNMPVRYVRLKGLAAGRAYLDEETGKEYSSDVLMQVGWPLPLEMGEYHAYRMHLVRVE
ncbi:MAG: alpha-galactosidase [Lachnospiraceae bacterium]|nr:alpha-galactosidase [Lachnospiraceae bacterium]